MDMELQQGLLVRNSMSSERIELHLQAENADAVLCELVSLIPEIKNNLRLSETLLNALRERESLCSTAYGDGVAFPHCRNALVGLVNKPLVVFGRHEAGVPFGAVDCMPAKLFFLVLAPNVSLHLQVLARLSRMVRDPRVRQILLKAQTVQEILDTIEEAEKR